MGENIFSALRREYQAAHPNRPRRKSANRLPGWLLSLLFILAFLTFPFWLPRIGSFFGALSPPDRQFHMEEYNADITINRDATVDVTETLVYSFDKGQFRRGTRIIPQGRIESFTNVRVAEVRGDGTFPYNDTGFEPDDTTYITHDPGTFGTTWEFSRSRGETDQYIRWIYGPTSNSTRIFLISYRVSGVIRVYGDRNLFGWYAVPPEWASAINKSRVRVTLPPGTDLGALDVLSTPRAEINREGNTVTWVVNGGLDDGLDVQLRMPQGVVQLAGPPGWQAAYDSEEARKQNLVAPVNFGLFVLGALILVLGPLGMLMHWYRRGRDKPVELHSDYLSEPPSDLPPGLVGLLLHENAGKAEVVATIVDLARKGKLAIQDIRRGKKSRIKDFEYTLASLDVDYEFEREVLEALFKRGSQVRLSALKNTFYRDLPGIYSAMDRELVALGYLPDNYRKTHTPYVATGCLATLLAVVGYIAAFTFLAGEFTFGLASLCLGAGVSGYVWSSLGPLMKRRHDLGAEEIVKWRAFERYLRQMEKYGGVEAASEKLERYLPYAIALGIQKEFLSQFEDEAVNIPSWYAVGISPEANARTATGVTSEAGLSSGSVGSGRQLDVGGAIQGASDSVAGSIQGLADSFTYMVNSTADVLTSQPPSVSSSGGSSYSSSSSSSSYSSSSSSSSGGSSGGGGGGAD
ncbi:MAG TPA: DUF2207 domain-containing protein [Chloroflexia bacterium]|jgi:uncharacterized membrane protein